MRIVYFFIIILLFTSNLSAELVELKNEFIKIIGHPETGRFIFKTTGGDPKLPASQNALLLYEDYPPTSFTTIKIDGTDYKFGDESGVFTKRMSEKDNEIIVSWAINNIEITQKLKFVKGPTTGNLDTGEIKYTIINKDAKKHDIGIRIMLDTYLGKEDGAPFRIPQLGDITTEKMLIGNEIPEYWYSYDDLSSPTVRAQGTLRIPNTFIPSRVIFASWERFNKYLWDFEIKSGRTFRRSIIGPLDSAMAIFWDPMRIEPNDSIDVETYYGLYGADLFKGKIFDVSLGGPAISKGDAFTVTADIQNVSPNIINKITAEIQLPKGLKVNTNEVNIKNLASLEKQEIKKTFWSIAPDHTENGFVVFKVKITGELNGQQVSEIVERKIQIETEKQIVKQYTLYDFSKLNELIQKLNQNIQIENDKLIELNNLDQNKTNISYTKNQADNDRNEIKNRIENSKTINNQIKDAAESAKKYETK